MKRMGAACMAIALVLAIGGCATIRTIAVLNNGRPTYDNEQNDSTAFKMEGHDILVDVRLNNSPRNYTFILDTGALTAISPKVAKELDINTDIRIEAGGSGGKMQSVPLVTLQSMHFLSADVDDCAAIVTDELESMDASIAGILGSNFLRYFKITINCQQRTIEISRDSVPKEIDNAGILIPFHADLQNGFAPMIDCTINDKVKTHGIIDTGTSAFSDVPLPIMERLDSFNNGEAIESIGSMSGGAFGMSEKSYFMKIKKIKYGSLTIENVPSISSSNKSNAVLIGRDFLDQFIVTLDYPAGKMLLIQNEKAVRSEYSSYGFMVDKSNGKTIVTGVWKSSPAYNKGIMPGDEIIAIDSRNTAELSLLEIMAIIRDAQSNVITLVCLNGNGQREIELIKQPMP